LEARCSWRRFTKHWTSIDRQASSRGRNTHLPPHPGRYPLPRRPSRPREDAPPCPVPTQHSARSEVKPSPARKLRRTRPQPRPRRASDSGRPAVGDSSCPAPAGRASGHSEHSGAAWTGERMNHVGSAQWAPTRRMMSGSGVSEAPPHNFAGSAAGAGPGARAAIRS
jgi:hypothetical protein